MSSGDITKSSKSADVTVVKQGHTTDGAFGSDPSRKVKGGRPVRDLTIPTSSK